jgi:hypothetical protein
VARPSSEAVRGSDSAARTIACHRAQWSGNASQKAGQYWSRGSHLETRRKPRSPAPATHELTQAQCRNHGHRRIQCHSALPSTISHLLASSITSGLEHDIWCLLFALRAKRPCTEPEPSLRLAGQRVVRTRLPAPNVANSTRAMPRLRSAPYPWPKGQPSPERFVPQFWPG